MDLKLKRINTKTKNMHYLEVIDWIKDKATDIEHEVISTSYFFQSLNDTKEENDLVQKVKKHVKAIIGHYNEKK